MSTRSIGFSSIVTLLFILVLSGGLASAKSVSPALAASPSGSVCYLYSDTVGREITIDWPANQSRPTTRYAAHVGEKAFDWSGRLDCGHRFVTWLWLSGEVHPSFSWGP